VLLTPPDLGLARLHINGFSRLKPIEQLQAAALALHRDLSVEPANLRLAVNAALDSGDVALAAFCTKFPDSSANFATNLLTAMRPGKAYWVDAPSGYIVGARGAAAVDFAGSRDELPSVVTGTLSAIESGKTPECVLVNRDRTLISDERMSWWAAASGVAMVDGELPVTVPAPLLSPPRARVSVRTTTLDRALQLAAIAGIVCVVLASIQYASIPAATSPSATNNKASHATAGALLDRIGTIAPEVVAQTQSATYASGTWMLALPDAADAEGFKRAVRAMKANGLDVQSTGAPSPRIRVQLP
jgi:hypothetical protein